VLLMYAQANPYVFPQWSQGGLRIHREVLDQLNTEITIVR